MGCNYSTDIFVSQGIKTAIVNEGSLATATSQLETLTERQIRMIRKTWKKLDDDLTGRGIQLFFKIMDADNNVQGLFPWRHVPRSSLVGNPWFRGHASRFMQAVGAVVDCLGSTEQQVLLIICDIGRKHAKTNNFDDSYFALFARCIMEMLEEEIGRQFNKEVKDAWETVIGCMVIGFKAGHKIEKERQMESEIRRRKVMDNRHMTKMYP